MDDNRIEIVAGLDLPKTKSTIKDELKDNVKPYLDQSKALNIICHIDDESIASLQSELNKISKGLKLDIPALAVKVDTNTNTGNKAMAGIEKSVEQTTEKAKTFNKIITDIGKQYIKPIQMKVDVDTTLEDVKARFADIEGLAKDGLSVKGVFGKGSGVDSDKLKKIVVDLQMATGETRNLVFAWKDINKQFEIFQGTYSDKGVAKQTAQTEKETAKLKKDINDVTAQYNELKGKVGSFSSGIFANIEKDGENVKLTFDDIAEHIKGLEDGTASVEQVRSELVALKGVIADIDSTLGQNQNKGFNRFQNAEIGAREFANTLDQLDLKIKDLDQSDTKVVELTEQLVNLKNRFNDLQSKDTRDNDWLQEWAALNGEARKLSGNIATVGKELQQVFRENNSLESTRNRIAKATAALNDYANKNRKVATSTKLMSDGTTTFKDKLKELQDRLRDKSLADSPETFKHLNEEIATFKKEADAAGLTVSSLFRNMKTQLGQVLMQWISIQGAVRTIKMMVEEVSSLDAAMINLRKVTDETDETYRKFIVSSQKQAAQLHATTTDVVEQSAEWAKLGFNIQEAQELSKVSMIYSKVGEVDNTTAVSDLVTVLKAFNQTADESIQTVDALNKLGNNFATDAKSLGEGISVSASALAMAGNDLNQALALITGGTEITQNARETGNAIKVISLRLRGMKGQLEELNEETEGIESISKIQTQILNLTNNKVNIFNDDGSFKSTYEILKEISEIYNDLSDTSKASLTEIMFGKVRANQGLAVIQAFQSGQIEKAYETAVNSAGSATEEFDKLSEGIAAHIQDFKQAFETLSNTIIDSDLIKFVVDSGTTILNILSTITDTLGTLPVLIAGVTTAFNIKSGKGRPKPNMPIYAPLQFCA